MASARSQSAPGFGAEAALAVGDEGEVFGGVGAVRHLGAEAVGRLVYVEAAAEDDVVDFLDLGALGGGEAAAAEAHDVEAGDDAAEGHDGGGAEGGDVLDDAEHAGNHDVAAEVDVLVDGASAAQEGVFADVHVPGDEGAVGRDDVVADDGVVGEVAVGHHVDVVADAGGGALVGAAVYGRAFAEGAVVADFDVGFPAAEGEVLGEVADDGPGVEGAAGTEGGVIEYAGVRAEAAAVAEPGLGADVGEGADFAVGAELGAFFDDGGGMDHGLESPLIHYPAKNSPRAKENPHGAERRAAGKVFQ